jgi:three-Cys-motif partner protein
MTDDFFDRKKPWSKIKDSILEKYLTPYIRKTSKLKLPIIIVDGFAGPGRFHDGSKGSPLIICEKAAEEGKRCSNKVLGLFIDKEPRYCQSLNKELQSYIERKSAFVSCNEFEKAINQIIDILGKCTAFFYLDPFGIHGIEIETLRKIFQRVTIASTEVLVNFSYTSFARHSGNWSFEDDENEIARKVKATKKEMVNRVMGGDYWIDIVTDVNLSKFEREVKVLQTYANQYREHFNYVGHCPVRDKDTNVAKYHLVFGTKHFDGLDLMSDIMHREHERFLKREYQNGYLFDMRPVHLKKDLKRLKQDIYAMIGQHGPISRYSIREHMVPATFMAFSKSDYVKAVEELLVEHNIYSSTGKVKRIHDKNVLLSKDTFKIKP